MLPTSTRKSGDGIRLPGLALAGLVLGLAACADGGVGDTGALTVSSSVTTSELVVRESLRPAPVVERAAMPLNEPESVLANQSVSVKADPQTAEAIASLPKDASSSKAMPSVGGRGSESAAPAATSAFSRQSRSARR